MPDKVLYTAEATSTGDGRSGHVASSDHRLDFDLAPPPEMGGDGNGTNPEQLFAAGYSACFHSALRVVARRAKVDPGDSTVTAQVGIGPDGDAFGLVVTLIIHIPGLRAGAGAGARRGGPPGVPVLTRHPRQHQRRAARSLRPAAGLRSAPWISPPSKPSGPGCTISTIEAERPSSSARGIHHTALLSSDVERTIRFYQGVWSSR
jgi:peroxiredoxin, Ohr subfamily